MAKTPQDRAAATASIDPFDELLGRAARLSPLPSTLHPLLHPGRELCRGRFEVRGRIGAGGMGVVHEAFDRERGELVAVKTLARLDPSALYRLKNEFRALAQVTHPNLVRLHELFADGELWLFSMERVRGEVLDAHVRPDGRLSVARLRAALRQIALGVQAVHEAGKLHRDLKPSNVLVTPEGRVVILDFGLAADPEPGGIGQTLEDESVSGTPAYMAPEQAAGRSASAASDAYAIGAMLFEALTGTLPFDGKVHEILYRKQRERAPRPSSLALEVPPDLDALCEALLAHDPRLRPAPSVIAELAGAPRDADTSRARSVSPARFEGGLVGRQAELAALRDALAAAERGRPVAVRVHGEAGLGKTALVSALLDELRESGRALVLRGRCHERESVPYKAFDRVVDELSRHLVQLGPDAAAILPRDARALARSFPVLARIDAFAGAPERSSPDEPTLRRRAFEAFVELLARLRDRQPLVIHVDDLHFIDHDSALLLEHLLSAPEPPAILLILGERLEPASPALARAHDALSASRAFELRQLALTPLPPDDAVALATGLLGPLPNAATLAGAIAQDAQGSPFLVCELARYVSASGRLPSAPVVSVDRAVESRLDGLTTGTREVFELLAVSGRPTPSDVLARASLGPEQVPARLDELCSVQLVRFAGAGSYECYHERFRRAAIERMDTSAAQHHRERLQEAYPSSGRDAPEALFELCVASGAQERAGEHAVAAADRAYDVLAFERAASYFAHALAVLPEDRIRSLRLRERRAEALSSAGRFAEAAVAFDEASVASDDAVGGTACLHRAALSFLLCGQAAQGLPRLRRVLTAVGIGWPRTRLGSYLGAGLRLLWLTWRGLGSSPSAAARVPDDAARMRLDRLLEAATLLPPYDLARGLAFMAAFMAQARHAEAPHRAVALAILASMLAGLGVGSRRAESCATEAMILARSHDHAQLRSIALNLVAGAHLMQGRHQSALDLARDSEEALGDLGRAAFMHLWTARFVQGHALLMLGRVAESAARFEQNARTARERGDLLALAAGSSVLGLLSLDDVSGAETLLARKQALVAAVGNRGVIGDSVALESTMLSLYCGQGVTQLSTLRSARGATRFFDSSGLLACCALQGPFDARCQRVIRTALRNLEADHGDPSRRGTAAQLRAALAHHAGDALAARQHLRVAAAHYEQAEMALHAALMRLREAELRSDDKGARDAHELTERLRAQGLVRPRAWADMLAPGLAPREA